MAQMHLTPLSEVVDEVWGKTGTKERDMMEMQLKEDVNAYYLGEAIRKARKHRISPKNSSVNVLVYNEHKFHV